MPAMTRTVVTLSANQASGVTACLLANPNRSTLIAANRTATNGALDTIANSGAGEGMPFLATSIVGFGGDGRDRGAGGPACPTEAIFVTGFAAADKITFWEA